MRERPLSSGDLEKLQLVNESLKHIERELKALSNGVAGNKDFTVSFPSAVLDSELANSLSETLIVLGHHIYTKARTCDSLQLGVDIVEKWKALPDRVAVVENVSKELLQLLCEAAKVTVDLLTAKMCGYNDLYVTTGLLLVGVTTDGYVVDLEQGYWSQVDTEASTSSDYEKARQQLQIVRHSFHKHHRYVLFTFSSEETPVDE